MFDSSPWFLTCSIHTEVVNPHSFLVVSEVDGVISPSEPSPTSWCWEFRVGTCGHSDFLSIYGNVTVSINVETEHGSSNSEPPPADSISVPCDFHDVLTWSIKMRVNTEMTEYCSPTKKNFRFNYLLQDLNFRTDNSQWKKLYLDENYLLKFF